MTDSILTVFGILAAAVALFAWGRPRSDVVAILVVPALNLSGVLTIQESLAGFGDPVVVLIAAVAIVGEGLVATGVAYRLGEAVMRAGGSNEARLVALVMLLAGSIGAFMSSSAIVPMFIPVVMGIANADAAVGGGIDQRHDDADCLVAGSSKNGSIRGWAWRRRLAPAFAACRVFSSGRIRSIRSPLRQDRGLPLWRPGRREGCVAGCWRLTQRGQSMAGPAVQIR
jgi:Citrate transporter